MMPSFAYLSVALLLGAATLFAEVAASARPRIPITLRIPPQSYVIPDALTNNTLDLAVRASGCPVGWAACSARTCYPLDGSQCCSDGTFCESGTYCDSVACCPIGEICQGSAPPTITIGGGSVPTDTDTFIPRPTTSHRPTTTTHPITPTSTPTPTPTTDPFDPSTEDPLGNTIFSVTPDVSVTATTPTSFLEAGTEPGEGLLPTSTGAAQFPLGGTNGAERMAGGAWMGVVLSTLAVFMCIA